MDDRGVVPYATLIFDQIRQEQSGEAIVYPTGQDVLAYIQDLYDTLRYKTVSDEAHITRLKKYLNFIGLGIDPQGHFPYAIRQSRSENNISLILAEAF